MDIHEYFSQLGKRSAARLTPEQRQARAQTAARERWKNDHSNANGKHQHVINPHNPNMCDTHNVSIYRCGAKA